MTKVQNICNKKVYRGAEVVSIIVSIILSLFDSLINSTLYSFCPKISKNSCIWISLKVEITIVLEIKIKHLHNAIYPCNTLQLFDKSILFFANKFMKPK